MITNADITLYNHHYNKETHFDDWQRTVIRGVRFYVDNKVALGDGGLNSTDVYKIRIPEDAECDREYLPEDAYASTKEVAAYWTLQNGDYVVLGESLVNIEKPSDLKQQHKQNCKIISWSDNRFGGLPHWRIGGV